MWPVLSMARVARCVLFVPLSLCASLSLGLWPASAEASRLHRYYCDSEALTHREAVNRVNWAWACGFSFCNGPCQPDWTAELALEACGYPVFSEPVPVEARVDEATGHFICHLDPLPGAHPSSAYFPGDDLDVRLSRLRLETQCRPLP